MTEAEYEAMAIITIRNYLNKDFTDDEVKNQFSLAIKKIVCNIKELESTPFGISQVKDGENSITYLNNKDIISKDISVMLPKPFIKLY